MVSSRLTPKQWEERSLHPTITMALTPSPTIVMTILVVMGPTPGLLFIVLAKMAVEVKRPASSQEDGQR